MQIIDIKKVRENATIPTRGTEYSAGLDLYACIEEPLTINSKEVVLIPSGIAMEIPRGYFGGLYSRSGLSVKKKLSIVSGTSVIDSDYRGEIGIPIINHSNEPQTIQPSERIAQLVIQPYEDTCFNEVNHLEETERGNCGFGSTGTH